MYAAARSVKRASTPQCSRYKPYRRVGTTCADTLEQGVAPRRGDLILTASAICNKKELTDMDLLTWAIIAVVVAVIAGALGFSGVARGAATIAKVLFGIFLVIALILFLFAVLGAGIVF